VTRTAGSRSRRSARSAVAPGPDQGGDRSEVPGGLLDGAVWRLMDRHGWSWPCAARRDAQVRRRTQPDHACRCPPHHSCHRKVTEPL
jgi:hypothetical protein